MLNVLVSETEATPNGEREQNMGKSPYSHLALTLAVLWMFPSFGAVLILLMERPQPQTPRDDGWWTWIQSVQLEHWVAAAILLTHAFLVCKALRNRFKIRLIKENQTK